GQAPSAMCLRLRRGWPLLAAPSISTSVAEYVGSSSPSRGLVHQPGGNFLNLRRFLGRSGAYIIADQFFTAFPDLIVSRGTVASCDEQFFEPVFAVPRVHGFFGPIEVPVVLAQRVAISVKELRARGFVPDILGLKEVEHSQEIDRIFSGSALVDVRAQRNLHRLEVPGDQALISHLTVARFVVAPACGGVNSFARSYVRKHA